MRTDTTLPSNRGDFCKVTAPLQIFEAGDSNKNPEEVGCSFHLQTSPGCEEGTDEKVTKSPLCILLLKFSVLCLKSS